MATSTDVDVLHAALKKAEDELCALRCKDFLDVSHNRFMAASLTFDLIRRQESSCGRFDFI